jgi:hypothetical protein
MWDIRGKSPPAAEEDLLLLGDGGYQSRDVLWIAVRKTLVRWSGMQ